MVPALITPTHRSIRKYYEQVAALRDQRVLNEMSVRSAFEYLLADTAKLKRWTFIPELSGKSAAGPSSAPTALSKTPRACRAATGKPRTPTTTSMRKSAKRSKRATRWATSSSKTPAGRPDPEQDRGHAHRPPRPRAARATAPGFLRLRRTADRGASRRPSMNSRSACPTLPSTSRKRSSTPTRTTRSSRKPTPRSSSCAARRSTPTSSRTPSTTCSCSTC